MAKPKLALFLLAAAVTVAAQHPVTITAAEAKDHVGERATVCGQVVSVHLAARSRGTPTFINLDKPYPNQIFTIVIWGGDRPKFGAPEQTYQGKQVCVTGTISSYRGVPEVVARDPSQLKIRTGSP
jgi:DNA/RNA endonuclease YhcR with UshA esterase domain